VPTRVAPRLPLVRFLEERTTVQRWIVASLAALVLVWRSLRAAAGTLLDRWWLDTVADAPIWARRTAAEFQLGLAAGAFVVLVLGSSVWIVLRIAQVDHGRRHRFWIRYDERIGPAHRWGLVALVVFLTWHIGHAAAGQWQSWLLFRHGDDLGVTVPEVGGDVGFYLFRFPLLAVVSSFVRQLLLVTIVVAAFGHLASGALRLPRGEIKSSPVAITHLSLLVVAFLAAQAVHEFVVARAATALDRVGAFDGPGYTQMRVERPALVVTALLTIATGFAMVTALRTGRWRAAVAVGIVAVAAHVVGVVVAPYVVERFVVAPAEAERQLWSIEHNLDATRAAYDLADVEPIPVELRDGVPPEEADAIATSSSARIPLFGTDQLATALQVQLGTAGTRIGDVDVEPYEVDGVVRPVYTAARAASRPDVPERGWVQEHLVYTHGDGVVAIAADTVDDDGRPDVRSLPGLEAGLDADLYYGEGVDGWYAIVGTARKEFDGNRYDGPGVALGSPLRRLALSLVTGDVEPLISGELGSDSMLLYRRSVRERLGAIAPFLTLDSDPYVVLDGDRAVWIVDAYTTSSTYPYAQYLPVRQPAKSPLARGEQNSVRASVKATVDAEDGTVHLYRTDGGDDPILSAWAEVFPRLFEDAADLPASLASHLRYPGDLFALQTAMLGRYHVDDAEALFNGAQRWTPSAAAAASVGATPSGPAPAVDTFERDEFSLVLTYGPGASDNPGSTRDVLAGIALARHGASPGLQLLDLRGDSLLSPQVAQSAIDADPRLAQELTLLNANGSQVAYGPLAPLVVGDGLIWARPITVVGSSPGSVPRLFGVAVVSDGLVGLGQNVAEAVASIGQPSAE
jgi:uncharacterized membrane protein (UPF0182 family)